MKKATLLKALNILTHGSMRGVSNKFKDEAYNSYRQAQNWMSDPGFQGIAIGKKEKDSEILSELVIKVFVEKKLPKSKVKNLVPTSYRIPGYDQLVGVDVVAIGKVELHMNTNRVRPAVPGFSVGRTDTSAGTLGCLVRKNGDPNGLYILSNAHVLANSGYGTKGDPIIQPGRNESGSTSASQDKIAELYEWADIDFNISAENKVDAAIAKVTDKTLVQKAIRKIGVPTGINTSPRLDMIIKKTGRTTDFTCGTITGVNARILVPIKTPKGTQKAWMVDQIVCTHYATMGDSGSILVTTSGKVVGLHMAGSITSNWFNKISNVMQALDISIVTSS